VPGAPFTLWWTKEEVNGNKIDVQAKFRNYVDWNASVTDHAEFLNNYGKTPNRYANLLGETSYQTVAKLLQQDGYATSSTYANSLIRVVESYDLQQYDIEAGAVASDVKPVFRLVNIHSWQHFFTADTSEKTALVNSGDWLYEGVGWNAPKATGNSVYRLVNYKTNEHLYTAKADEKEDLVASGVWKYEGIAFNSAGETPVYRLYDPVTDLHMFTSDEQEKNSLTKSGWVDEGVAFYASEKANVYRFANWKTNDHFLTRDEKEKNILINNGEWAYEGVAFSSATSGKPVYRLVNPINNFHMYTTDIKEKGGLTNSGWLYEGVAWYDDGTVPVYRMVNPRDNNHMFTKDINEVNVLKSQGWRSEGIAFHVKG
jgi:hypothetical protein